jgi:cytochrome c oxidase subunit II
VAEQHGGPGTIGQAPNRRAPRFPLLVVLSVLGLAGCGGGQSTLQTNSDAAGKIDSLWWVMLVGSAIVLAVVLALLALGLLRRRGIPADERGRRRPGTTFVAISGVVVPTAVLIALFVLTVDALPTTSPNVAKTKLAVEVVGRQWFWDVTYPAGGARTANEIHIPVGVPVDVRVTSRDVVHSLWVPELNRKIDAIPGRMNHVVFDARRPGIFRGQCAEFCGLQHAHMALYVVAEPRAEFERWLARTAQPAQPPANADLERGQQVLLGSACEYCHRIAGTNASGTIGPDLTHVASRLSLGAATIPNGRGYLAGWILDPQHIKPGNKMPGTNLTGPDLQALLDYLESLR